MFSKKLEPPCVENLIKAYQLLYEAVSTRKVKEILKKMEEKENGKRPRIQNQ